MPVDERSIRHALSSVVDPELGVNVVDLGLVDRIEIDGSAVRVAMGMTSPACPVGPFLRDSARGAIEAIDGVASAEVELLRDFRWSPGRMSPSARAQLGVPSLLPDPRVEAASTAESAAEPAAQGPAFERAPLLLLAIAALIAAMWGGIARTGLTWPVPHVDWVLLHGPLMVAGFLGTLISLERAVGLEERWAWAVPILAALGALTLMAPLPAIVPALLATGASAGLVAVYARLRRLDPSFEQLTLGVAAICWLIGNIAWLTNRPLAQATPWWMAFLVLTIAGERLELNRYLSPSPSTRRAFVAAVALVVAGALVGFAGPQIGARIWSVGFIVLAAWLAVFDVARRTIRQRGLQRFTAACLLLGYLWLLVGGALALAWGLPPAGVRYDAILHAVFVGFVFSMIFGHAPVVFPAVLRRPLGYHPVFYAHLLALHATLVARVAGDLAGNAVLRQHGAIGNAVAIVLFVIVTVGSVARGDKALQAA